MTIISDNILRTTSRWKFANRATVVSNEKLQGFQLSHIVCLFATWLTANYAGAIFLAVEFNLPDGKQINLPIHCSWGILWLNFNLFS